MSEELPRKRKTAQAVDVETVTTEPTAVEQEPEEIELQVETGIVEFPMTTKPLGYLKRRYDVKLSGQQAETIRKIHLGLSHAGATLKNGKHVDNGTDAIKWLLENVV
jgi:hypothetical protein